MFRHLAFLRKYISQWARCNCTNKLMTSHSGWVCTLSDFQFPLQGCWGQWGLIHDASLESGLLTIVRTKGIHLNSWWLANGAQQFCVVFIFNSSDMKDQCYRFCFKIRSRLHTELIVYQWHFLQGDFALQNACFKEASHTSRQGKNLESLIHLQTINVNKIC